jgi:hypothetical protein
LGEQGGERKKVGAKLPPTPKVRYSHSYFSLSAKDQIMKITKAIRTNSSSGLWSKVIGNGHPPVCCVKLLMNGPKQVDHYNYDFFVNTM